MCVCVCVSIDVSCPGRRKEKGVKGDGIVAERQRQSLPGKFTRPPAAWCSWKTRQKQGRCGMTEQRARPAEQRRLGGKWWWVSISVMLGVMLGHCIWVSLCSVMARTHWLGHKLKPENEILHVKMMRAKFLLRKGTGKRRGRDGWLHGKRKPCRAADINLSSSLTSRQADWEAWIPTEHPRGWDLQCQNWSPHVFPSGIIPACFAMI